MKHIVIDFEMQHGEMQLLQSAPNVYQTEIIEIGAVMLIILLILGNVTFILLDKLLGKRLGKRK